MTRLDFFQIYDTHGERFFMKHLPSGSSGPRTITSCIVRFLVLFTAMLFGAQHSMASVSTGQTTVARLGSSSTSIAGGKVLVAGGYTWINSVSTKLNSSEVFDPATETFTPVAAMAVARERHAAVALRDGRVLVIGGYGNNTVRLASAEIYDPASDSWHTTGPMTSPRSELAARLLPDGRVLVYGDGNGSAAGKTEVFDPVTETFSASGMLLRAAFLATPAVLDDGRVLLMGGYLMTTPTTYLASVQMWDPVSGLWSEAAPMNFARAYASAVTLANGKVLVAGGRGDTFPAAAELYDPQTGTFSVTGALAVPRMLSVLQRLDDGVVTIGGLASNYALEPAIERYDVATGLWSTVGKMAFPRRDHGLHVLPGSRVLSVGGTATPTETAEIFDLICASGPSSLSAPGISIRGNGGTGSVTVTVPTGCPWEVRRMPSWATVTSGGRNIGSGIVNYTVAQNTSYGRGATPLMADLPYALNQAERECQPSASTFLSPATVNYPTAGGSGSINVYYDSVCAWSVVGAPAWVNVLSGASGKGDGSFYLSVGQNAAFTPRSATLTVGTASLVVNQAAACDTSVVNAINPLSSSFAASAGSATVSVSAAAGCSWFVTGMPSWITLSGSTSRLGPANLTFTIAANSQAARSATFTIAGKSYTVDQASGLPVCDPASVATLSSSSFSSGIAATSGSVSVTYGAGCSWSVTGAPAWITISAGATGTGNGTVSFNIAANTGVARSATLTIAGKSFTVNQAANNTACDPSGATLSSYSASIPTTGSTVALNVTYPGCSWSVTGAPSWVTVTSGATGVGNGSVQLSIASNTGSGRSATLTIANKSYVISQTGTAYCVTTAMTSGVPNNGSLSSMTGCMQNARGAAYYADRYSINANAGQQITISLTSGAFDSYVYLKNPSGSVIAQNDDGGGGTNSRIPATSGTFTIPAGMSGTFIIEATTYYSGVSGPYTLTATVN